ncbi:hypothetical protein [Stutzerimonas stutzeri]|uniref:hypothetical protein n=1 Tax=Stutzerimonas stutzeri TaxID=316 RepID=UPI0015E3D3A4|nr:hypothetical protein [Stutzerimonas stutzeri]MBA1280399.1 hypothetical protein [Stutzerimonas stutzeri]
MNEVARRSYLKANALAKKARQFKVSGSTKMAAEAIEEARWHRARARSLTTG